MADVKDAAGAETQVGLHTRGRKSGFDKPSDYTASLKKTPQLLAKRAFFVRSAEEQMADKAAASGDMRKVLNWFHVMALGTGDLGAWMATGRNSSSTMTPVVPARHESGWICVHVCLCAECASALAIKYCWVLG